MGKSGKVDAVQQPSYASQLKSNLSAQGSIFNQLLGLEQQYAPQQTALAGQLQSQALGQGVGMVGRYAPELQSIYSQQQQQAIAGDPLYSRMYQSAIDQINAGESLTPEESVMATQGALQGLAQAGRANSNASIFNQILARTGYAQQRYQQRLANASSVYGQIPGAVGYTNAANVGLGSALNAANTLSNFNLNPESGYAQNIQDANQSAQMSANAANANRSNGILGGVLGLGGAILGGPIGGSIFAGLGGGAGGSLAGTTATNSNLRFLSSGSRLA